MWCCQGRCGLLVVRGPLTWRTSTRVQDHLRCAVEAGARDVTVDLRHVTTVDRAGVAVLVVYARLLHGLGGSLEVSDWSATVRALINELGLTSLLGSRQEARRR